MNLDTHIDAIWAKFSIIAKCRSCEISITVENGDFSKLFFHTKNSHYSISQSPTPSLSLDQTLKDVKVETEDTVTIKFSIEEKEETEQDFDFGIPKEDRFDTNDNQISNTTVVFPDKKKRYRNIGGRKSKEEKKSIKELKMRQYNLAIEEFKQNKLNTYYSCAKKYGVSSSTLKRLIVTGKSYTGSGRVNKVLTESEQGMLRDHVKKTSDYSYHDLRLRIQELLHTIVRYGMDQSINIVKLRVLV